MLQVYRYRLYPTAAQASAIRETLERLRVLYNAALQERRDAYRKQGVSVTRAQQEKLLTEIKRNESEYTNLHTHLMQDAVTRLDRAFQAFFRRVKARQKPGYPRFKGRGRYRSFSFKDAIHGNGAKLVSGNKRLRISGVGNVKIKLHRPIEGRIKTIGITLDGDGHFYAAFTCDNVPTRELERTGKTAGIDVGISSFLATSDGDTVANPRCLETSQRAVARTQRKVSRRKRGSNRRRKAVALLARKHANVRNARKDFHHKTALMLVRRYDRVAVEELNIQGMARGMLSRAVLDAAWGSFLEILRVKAESAGREVIEVDARGTSQECSQCGEIVRKDLRVRTHECPHCGLVLDRDVNAARNILGRSAVAAAASNQAGTRPSGRSRTSAVAQKRVTASPPVDPRSPHLAH